MRRFLITASSLAIGLAGCGSDTGGIDSASAAAAPIRCSAPYVRHGNRCVLPTPVPTPTPTPTPTPVPVPTVECWDGSKVIDIETCPVPPPTVPEEEETTGSVEPPPLPGDVLSPTLAGREPIQANFDTDVAFGNMSSIPESSAPDVVGAFRFVCGPGELRYDDPLVYPDQPGKSHLHQFFGKRGVTAYTKYEDLRANGDSTCSSSTGKGDGSGLAVNGSGYWEPATIDRKRNKVRTPDRITVYYKRLPDSSPACRSLEEGGRGKCVPIPHGLRFVFGYDMVTRTPPTGGMYITCQGKKFNNFDEAADSGLCVAGEDMGYIIQAPPCWDGKRLDSANHRDHVAYYDNTVSGNPCPKTHPYQIPRFTGSTWFTLIEGDDIREWILSSDMNLPDLKPWTTFHMDYDEGWDPVTKRVWTDNCINKMLNCSGGVDGSGRIIRGAAVPYWPCIGKTSFRAPDCARFKDIPERPVMETMVH